VVAVTAAAASAGDAAPPAGLLADPQPRQLIVTVYGLYARAEHDWLPIAAVVDLMRDLGVGAQAVRSSISRLKRRDTLRSVRRDGTAGYALSPAMLEILREGDRRIFDRGPATPDEGWVQVVFTVPEARRDQRHALRTRLAGLGFGPMAPGVWIAPGTLAEEVRVALEREGLAGYVDLFRGEHLGPAPLADRVREWWDLDQIAARYEEFAAAHRPLARRAARRAPTGAEAFAGYVRMLTVWRRLRYLDPGLPLDLLPRRWPGVPAAELFTGLDAALRPVAQEHALRAIRGGLDR
jgi:phenylacetic acid degradation operon negative regulatory protein